MGDKNNPASLGFIQEKPYIDAPASGLTVEILL